MAAPALFFRGTLTTTSATLYTAPANGMVITNVVFTNTQTSTPATATLTLNGFAIASALSVPPNGLVTLDIKQVLNSGQIVAGLSGSAGAIQAHISGVTL